MSTTIKASHKAVQAYYEGLKAYAGQDVSHEGAVSTAFQNLLAEVGKLHKWVLIPQLTMKVKGHQIRPDGTLRHEEWMIPRGFWEAKDTEDDLDVEIRKKINKGYPTVNIIFEDTRQGVLYQNGREVYRAKLSDPEELVAIVNQFFNHTEKDIEGFEQAVTEFQGRIPHLGKGLQVKIQAAHEDNAKFREAFDSLLELCQTALNPNISVAAVDEMLVQHLLTERLFDRIFQDQDFIRRNVIACEVEKVIDALVIQSFNRSEFMRSLDPFYKAIEDAARTIEDFGEKQHFLNTVYERFFQGYSVQTADTHGIVYTPQQAVDFMCASVEEILDIEFGLKLGSPGVQMIDPCTGTGNFAVNMMRRVPKKDLPRFYREQLFANEVMLLPYYIAAQNIEHEYYDLTGKYEPFEGLCFVDTLELDEGERPELVFLSVANTDRIKRQHKMPIKVVIGNPPYNVGQINENDNNKNRKYKIADANVTRTFVKDSASQNKVALSDVYVKFFRWAIDRLRGNDGIVCYISNNSFIDHFTFDGMRKHLAKEFNLIYVFNLRGNGRLIGERRTLDGRNIFADQVRVGVSIVLLVRNGKSEERSILYHQVPDRMKTREKKAYLAKFRSIADVPWTSLQPDNKGNWLVAENADEFSELLSVGTKGVKAGSGVKGETIFENFSLGLKTNRDEVVYDFDRRALTSRIKDFIEEYNSEVDRYHRSDKKTSVNDFVKYEKIKWSRDLKLDLKRKHHADFDPSKIRTCLYRPFSKLLVYFDKILNEEIYGLPRTFPSQESEGENRVIIVSDVSYRASSYTALMTVGLAYVHLSTSSDAHQCFPFYIYDEDGGNRWENITDWAMKKFREHYEDESIAKWDVFHYIYGVLQHPMYRARFAGNIKQELPRIPFMEEFRAIAEAGKRLADLHVNYESVEPWPLEWIYAEDKPLSYHVEKMRLSSDKTTLYINESLSLGGIPPETFQYRLGNRSTLEWVIDQHQVSTDKRSGIVTDPNRADDPEYIVRLVERVVRVSQETVNILQGLTAHEVTHAEAHASSNATIDKLNEG